jgi:hypothetical protein
MKNVAEFFQNSSQVSLSRKECGIESHRKAKRDIDSLHYFLYQPYIFENSVLELK